MEADFENNPKLERNIEKIYFACKGDCDFILEREYIQKGLITTWEDIGDIAIPIFFLRFVFANLNSIADERRAYSNDAFETLKYFILAMGQKVLRETTIEEKKRAMEGMDFFRIFEA
jgi:hypothetical protein